MTFSQAVGTTVRITAVIAEGMMEADAVVAFAAAHRSQQVHHGPTVKLQQHKRSLRPLRRKSTTPA
jgi:hypothetical protein